MKKLARKYQPKITPLKPLVDTPKATNKTINKSRSIDLHVLLKISKEQLEEFIKRLPEQDKALIVKYYDLDFKRNDIPFSKEDRAKFYGTAYQKLKKMVKKLNGDSNTPTKRTRKETVNLPETAKSEAVHPNHEEDAVDVPKQPTEKVNPLGEITINIQNQQILNQLSPLVNIIVALRMHYSTEAIAKYLQIDEDVVRNILRQYLVSCKESLNMIFEDLINGVDEETIRLERKKDEI